jgi:Fe-coproporphyrin III synthase
MKDKRNFKLEPFIFLYITEKCQLRCKHCYMGDRLYHPQEMDFNEIVKILKYFKVLGHYKLYLLGGEPSLHPKIKEIVLSANEIGYEVVLTSNGQFDSKMLQKFNPKTVHSFSFSLDSCDEAVHDQIRGKGTFKRLIKNIKETQDKGFQVRLICTVSKMNLEKSLDLIDFCSKQLGADMLSYHYFSPIGLARDRVDELILPEEWIGFCSKIEEYPIPDNFWVYYPPTFIASDKLSHFIGRGYKGCTARWFERLAILPSGRIYACSVFFDTDDNFALWQNGQLKIRDSKETEMKSIYQLNENCLDCLHHYFCLGGCGALRDLDKNFPGVVNSENCDRKIIPICPLWTTYAGGSDRPPRSVQELR